MPAFGDEGYLDLVTWPPQDRVDNRAHASAHGTPRTTQNPRDHLVTGIAVSEGMVARPQEYDIRVP